MQRKWHPPEHTEGPVPYACEVESRHTRLQLQQGHLHNALKPDEIFVKQLLSDVAHQAVRLYENNAFPLTQLADVFGHRLSVPGWPAAEITPFFQDVAAEAERLIKISTRYKT
jgi:hypothetical protein